MYKWVDEKGVVHYGDRPAQPGAVPLEKESVPFSNTGSLPPDTPTGKRERAGAGRQGARSEGRASRPKPTLVKPKMRLDNNKDLQLTGTLRNSGKAVCWFPTVEVEVFDENGSRDGSFETALARELAPGAEVAVQGKYLTPVGDRLSWAVTPRCGEKPDVVYGAHKRGAFKIAHSRTLRLRRR